MLGLRVVPNLNRNSIYGGTRPTEAPGRIAPVGVVATDRQKLHSPHWKPRIGHLDRLPQQIEYIGLRRILRAVWQGRSRRWRIANGLKHMAVKCPHTGPDRPYMHVYGLPRRIYILNRARGQHKETNPRQRGVGPGW